MLFPYNSKSSFQDNCDSDIQIRFKMTFSYSFIHQKQPKMLILSFANFIADGNHQFLLIRST